MMLSWLARTHRLVTATAGLLVVTIGGFTWIAYIRIRGLALSTAAEHLTVAASQLAAALTAGLPARINEIHAAAAHPEIVSYLTRQTNLTRAPAAQVLTGDVSRDSLISSAELWDSVGRRVLTAGRALPELPAGVTRDLIAAVRRSGAAVGPLRVVAGGIVFPTMASLTARGQPVGAVVLWRRVQAAPGATQRFTALIGDDASLSVGNGAGDVWTDLNQQIDAPPLDVTHATGAMEYARAGRGQVLAAAAPLSGTPWWLVIELPRSRTLAPAHAFLRESSLVALLFLGVGTAASWLLGKRMADPLRRLEDDVVSNAVDASPAGLIMVDPTGVIVLVNRSITSTFGYSANELLAQPVEILLPRHQHDRHVRDRNGFLAHPTARRMGAGRDLFGQHKDGRRIPVEIGLNPVKREGGTFVIASVVDISERKHTETELRRSNEELERFAYVASHDLQEPLRMVASYVELLARRNKGKLGPDADEFIGYAMEGTHRMQRLIDDLLSFSRVTTRGAALVMTDAGAAFDRALASLRLAIDESHASVTRDALPGVLGDAGQLEHLFLNLVSNAVKFRGTDTPRIHATAQRNGDTWTFQVKDNGIGIDAQYFERIFVIFQRLHGRDEYPGTGIGLAIAKKIVERHGGRIWVESSAGQGATFCFTMPVALG
jgi:PAS domain S-box-containing protein